MIELTQHIENLLLENDFVIIPDFGGFVAHYNQAQKADKENTFCPPTRTIGFNPHLTLNDGLLVQSYMSVHDIDFSGATKMVNEAVRQLVATLHEDGKVELPHIGELRYTIHRTYDFVPYNEKVITPSLYGLQTFVMQPLSELQKSRRREARGERSYNIRLNKALLRNAVAVVVALVTFYALSTPIENTYKAKGSYAQLLPVDVFETIENQSVLTTVVKNDKDQTQTKKQTRKEKRQAKKNGSTTTTTTNKNNNNNQQPANNINQQQPANNGNANQQPANNNNQQPVNNNNQQQPAQQPAANNNNNNQQKPANNGNANQQPANNNNQQQATNNKPANNNNQQVNNNQQKPATNANNQKPSTTTTASDGKYHVIVASSITRTKAEELVAKLKNLGYALATILDNGSTIRVSLTSSSSKEEANKAMNQARTNNDFKDAWVLNY